jgi:predicted nucleic acid-binding protein
VSYLLDTNVLSESLRPSPAAAVMNWLASADEAATFVSVITLGELRFGIENLIPSKRTRALEQWFEGDFERRFGKRLIAVDAQIASAWGSLTAEGRRQGRGLGVPDALLAATARVHDLTLVTRDVRDFSGLGIRLLDPWQSRPHPR